MAIVVSGEASLICLGESRTSITVGGAVVEGCVAVVLVDTALEQSSNTAVVLLGKLAKILLELGALVRAGKIEDIVDLVVAELDSGCFSGCHVCGYVLRGSLNRMNTTRFEIGDFSKQLWYNQSMRYATRIKVLRRVNFWEEFLWEEPC